MTTVRIAKQFSEVPAGRYRTDGKFSGERFRDEILLPELQRSAEVTVELDGTAGYGSSFLEEAFGGLVRKGFFTPAQLHQRLKVKAGDPAFRAYESAVWRFIDNAQSGVARVQ